MKEWFCIAVVAIVSGSVVVSEAEEIERSPGCERTGGHRRLEKIKCSTEENGHHRRSGRGRGMPGENMMINALRSSIVAENIGLSEEQRQKIEKKMQQIEESHTKLKYKMEKAALKQARLMTSKKLDVEALMDVIEETGRYRTQMAKQRIKLIIFMRETLTPDQIETMRGMMHKRMKARHQARSKKSASGGHKEGKRSNHNRDKHQAKPPEQI
jgi:Spy/CpxP family protein refolding chaperone